MINIPMVSIVANNSGTGKTTLIEKLINELTLRGFRIGTIKSDSHGFEMDKEGKDTWRHSQAGAKATAIIGAEKFAIIQKTQQRKSIDELAKVFTDVDLIIIEGYKKGDKPKIEVVRRAKGIMICSPIQDLLAVATDIKELPIDVPQFNLDDIVGLTDFIQGKFLNDYKKKASVLNLNHFDQNGSAQMVDVTEKNSTTRVAVARGQIMMKKETLNLVSQGKMSKGDVLGVARVAGIMAVKETSRLIPMCHPLIIGSVNIDFDIDEVNNCIGIQCSVKIVGQTGVEMEALTGVNVAALTIYDMCKAVDKDMVITNIRVARKIGGKSGNYERWGEIWGK